MIEIENIICPSVDQWKMAIEGMRIPLWSMDKSDSFVTTAEVPEMYIGEKDLALMRKLAKAGSDHRKFLRMLPVHMKITAPMVWLMQFDTYKIGTVSCGSSKMHKLMRKQFELSDFSFDNKIVPPDEYQPFIDSMNELRDRYLACENEDVKREIWQAVIDALPESYNQTRIWSANYEVLWSIYRARRNHKLGDWHVFCDTIVREVPYFKEIFEIE